MYTLPLLFYYWNFITKYAHPVKFRKSLITDIKTTVAFPWVNEIFSETSFVKQIP